MLVLSLSLAYPAQSSSLDLIEVGGAWGSPGATNPTALWWNPAGLAVAGGTQLLVEGAPTSARFVADRYNPDYGVPDPTFVALGYPAEYDYGGVDNLTFSGIVPFLGISSDFTVDGLGIGIGLYVPIARGGTSDQAYGPNRYALREGNIQVLAASLGAAYELAELLSVGGSVSLLDSTYEASLDTSIYPDIAAEAEAQAAEFNLPRPGSYQDAYLEHPGYTATSIFALKTQALTFGAGLYLQPLRSDLLGLSLAYNHGVRVDNRGPVVLDFLCPPEHDNLSRAGAQAQGTCDARLQGTGAIGYRLPSRVHLGVVGHPREKLRLEAFGSYVLWSAFTDYDISTQISADQIQVEDPTVAEETAALVSQRRQWARDNRDSFFVGVDGKLELHRLLGVGLRGTFDRSAIPDRVLSANNLDADTFIRSGLLFSAPIQQLTIGLSFSHHFLATRDVTDSAYALSIDGDPDPRYFYPSGAGRYSGSIDRIGISLKGNVGGRSRQP